MEFFTRAHTRRDFFRQLAAGTASFALGSEELHRAIETGFYQDLRLATPALTEGPFYPDKLPLDKDNDLIYILEGKRADGTELDLFGKITDRTGTPINNATIEIWQVDAHGAYIHSQSGNAEKRDPNFQGFGQFETDSTGEFRFKTIIPVAYPGRTPHIHFKVKLKNRDVLTSQIMFKDNPGNARDGVLRSAGDSKTQALLLTELKPKRESAFGGDYCEFPIILGITPEDNHHH
jgi:protocatechuate 3,4-dioxygenase, beta subunit